MISFPVVRATRWIVSGTLSAVQTSQVAFNVVSTPTITFSFFRLYITHLYNFKSTSEGKIFKVCLGLSVVTGICTYT